MPRKPKDKYALLDDEFKDRVNGASDEEIDKELAAVAKAQESLDRAKEQDEDYNNLKVQFHEAGEQYREGKKLNKLKVQYCVELLRMRGKE